MHVVIIENMYEFLPEHFSLQKHYQSNIPKDIPENMYTVVIFLLLLPYFQHSIHEWYSYVFKQTFILLNGCMISGRITFRR